MSQPTQGLSVEAAAKRIGIGRTYAYQLIAEGRIRSVKTGKRRIVPDTAVGEFLADSTSTTANKGEPKAAS